MRGKGEIQRTGIEKSRPNRSQEAEENEKLTEGRREECQWERRRKSQPQEGLRVK